LSSRYLIVGSAARIRESSFDLAVLDGDVEVDAHEDALALRIEIPDGHLFHVLSL